MPADFDIQRALNDMETRIRQDIQRVADISMEGTSKAQLTADTALIQIAQHGGRLKSLEEKAEWMRAGVASLFVAMCGFVWHILSGRG